MITENQKKYIHCSANSLGAETKASFHALYLAWEKAVDERFKACSSVYMTLDSPEYRDLVTRTNASAIPLVVELMLLKPMSIPVYESLQTNVALSCLDPVDRFRGEKHRSEATIERWLNDQERQCEELLGSGTPVLPHESTVTALECCPFLANATRFMEVSTLIGSGLVVPDSA